MTEPQINDLLPAAKALLPEIVATRRRLHRRPERGLTLPATQALVVEELTKLGLTPQLGTATTSVAAVIEGNGPGPTVLLRGDMDALPLTEETGLDFSSEVDGMMHACGHDTHVAMLLGAARLLVDRRATFGGRVLLMFQPGEEGFHGARVMLEEALLDAAGPVRPTAAFALHISTEYPTSTINLRPGPTMACADFVNIDVKGRGGHASQPSSALDPITIAAEIVIGLQTLVTRQVEVFDPAVITIAHISSGTTNNIIPETARLEGTIRTFSEKTRTVVHEGIVRLVNGLAGAYGASADVELLGLYPVTVNDPAFAELVTATATELIGAEAVNGAIEPVMGAEDFSYVLQQVPGAMAFLGGRPASEDPATAPANHSNKVVFDEPAMAVGVATYVAVALRSLARA
ncbi:MAG TPA: M20 family metallopeptidase [Candidatus Limnocylindrales bacterium]|nr:M20 family metallopeptidase [Candidatus Limnocylindrales bacterium]